MDVIDSKSDRDLMASLLAEIAKTRNELRCCQADVQKAQSRLSFALVVLNKLLERSTEKDQ
jgi:hypothetical protein